MQGVRDEALALCTGLLMDAVVPSGSGMVSVGVSSFGCIMMVSVLLTTHVEPHWIWQKQRGTKEGASLIQPGLAKRGPP